MTVIDLTHTVYEGMPVYPGTEAPELLPANTHEEHGFRETRISLHSHTGTHIDPPAHIISGAATLDSFPADAFVGRGLVVDAREVGAGGRIGMDVLMRYSDKLASADFLLFCTGYDKLWGTDAYFGDYPTLSDEVLDHIIQGGYKGIGLDVISLDAIDNANLTYHNRLFSSRKIINIENLCGIDRLVGADFTLCALPLKIEDSDGAPARVIALVDE